jgi:hypothetical protein
VLDLGPLHDPQIKASEVSGRYLLMMCESDLGELRAEITLRTVSYVEIILQSRREASLRLKSVLMNSARLINMNSQEQRLNVIM